MPVVFHTGTSDIADPNEVLDLADKYPNIRLCVAHCARFNKKFFERYNPYKYKNVFIDMAPFDLLFEMIKENNVKHLPFKMDLSGKKEMMESLYHAFPHNIMWGSDVPWMNSYSLINGIKGKKILKYPEVINTLFSVDEMIRKRIANKNVLRFIFGTEELEERFNDKWK